MSDRSAVGFTHILCPVDFSAHSKRALRLAGALADRFGASLSVLYVSDPLLDAAAAAAAYNVEQLKVQSRSELQQLVRRLRLPVKARCLTVSGDPAKAIVAAGEQLNADLVVVGSHGLTGTRRLLLGSTTAELLRLTRVPVLVVPRRPYSARTLASWPDAKVLVAVDLAGYRAADVRALRSVLKALAATPLFLHVIRPVAFPAWLRLRPSARRRGTDATAALEALAKKVGVKGRCQLMFGDPADEIAAAAAGARAGLVVLKLRSTPRLGGPRRGSISYQLAARGAVPVLALP